MIDISDHPEPAHDPANVAIVLVGDDDPDDFDIAIVEDDMSDEAVAARTEFSWTVRFTVSGTWVADGFDLDHERAFDMLKKDLGYAHDYEVSAQVLEAPPPTTIRAIQGGRGDEAKAGQALLDSLLVAEVTRLRADIAARDRGETGAVEQWPEPTVDRIAADLAQIKHETETGAAEEVKTAEHAESCSCDLCVDAELADLTRDHSERQRRLAAEPEAIDADEYQRMLEVLPPARMIGGAFLVGEAMSHDDNGQARYAYYFRRGDQHFHGADLTVPEFDVKHGGR
mgnify:CR=1 FL=1